MTQSRTGDQRTGERHGEYSMVSRTLCQFMEPPAYRSRSRQVSFETKPMSAEEADTRLQCLRENAILHQCEIPVTAMLRVKTSRIKLRGIVRRDVPNRQRCAGQVYQAYSASIFAPSSRNLGAGSGALSFYKNLHVRAGSCLAAEWLNARAFPMRSDQRGALLRISH
jgi:hypothetical protein